MESVEKKKKNWMDYLSSESNWYLQLQKIILSGALNDPKEINKEQRHRFLREMNSWWQTLDVGRMRFVQVEEKRKELQEKTMLLEGFIIDRYLPRSLLDDFKQHIFGEKDKEK
jgi:hypothetical protein